MAIAGALFAGPHGHAVVKVPARSAAVVEQVYTARTTADVEQVYTARTTADVEQVHAEGLVIHHDQTRRYIVQPGDTLASIAQRFYGNTADWPRLYQANRSVIQNPGVIYPGEVLIVPYEQPASSMTATSGASAMSSTSTALSGTLSCSGLEDLWEEAGGSDTQAVTAASIAMAESSGEQFATGPVGERGYWQINPDHGSLSTYDPLGNAKAAVVISGDGANWSPWTTFTSGAYLGRC